VIDATVAPPQPAAAGTPDPPLTATVHRLAQGTELLGEYQGSGLQDPRFLVRRSDGQVMQLPRLLYRLAGSLDGRRDDEEVARALSGDLGQALTGEQVRFLVEQRLHPTGIIADPGDDSEDAAGPRNAPVVSDPLLSLRYRVGVIPAGAVWRVAGLFAPMFRRPVWAGALALFVALDVAIVAQGDLFDRTLAGATQIIRQPSLTLAILGITLLALAFHECGHVAACRYGGARPGDMGIGLYIVWPALYSTVTDAYRLDRVGRLRTDLGGVYFNAIAISVVSALYLHTGQPWLFVLLLTLHTGTAWQFIPTIRFDGYYMLADLVGVPELFGYLKPVLTSLLPGRPTHPKVRELKPWARRVIVTWVVTVIPTLAFWLLSFLVVLPSALPVVWVTTQEYLDGLGRAVRAGEVTTTALGAVQFLLLLLPWVGATLIAWSLLSMLNKAAVRRWGRGRIPASTWAAVRSGLALLTVGALGAAVVARVAEVAASLPASRNEIELTDGALALLRTGASEPTATVGEFLLRAQLVGYAAVTGAYGRHADAVAGSREIAVVATTVLVGCLVAMVLLRRLRPLAAGLPLLATSVLGPAVAAMATVSPGITGAAWAAAGVLCLSTAGSRATVAAGAVAIGVGLATEPLLAIPLAVCLAAGILRNELGREGPSWWPARLPEKEALPPGAPLKTSGPRHQAPARPRAQLPAGGRRWLLAALPLVLATAVATAAGGRGSLPLSPPERTILLLTAALVGIVALAVRWLRPVAAAAGALAVVAALPWSQSDSALLLAVLAAIPVAALIIDASTRLPVHERPHPLLRAAVAAPVLVVTVVGALFVPVQAPALPHTALAAWLQASAAPAGAVAVPAGLWGDLVRDGVPPGRLVRATGEAAGGADWVVTVGERQSGQQALVTFGTGATALSVVPSSGT
jgi:putative peptide zinc metalloprotease protein